MIAHMCITIKDNYNQIKACIFNIIFITLAMNINLRKLRAWERV